MKRWNEAWEDSNRAREIYGRLVQNRRGDLLGWEAISLLTRCRALYALGQKEAADGDRNGGVNGLRWLIEQGEPVNRVVLLRESVLIAQALLDVEPLAAARLLDDAIRETENGLRQGQAVVILRQAVPAEGDHL
jgi:hypothetical protein